MSESTKVYPPFWNTKENKLEENTPGQIKWVSKEELQDILGNNVAIKESQENPGMTGQYTFRGGIEPLDFIKSNKMGFAEGNVVKYLYRYPFKHGVRDLEKARFYIDLLIKEHVA